MSVSLCASGRLRRDQACRSTAGGSLALPTPASVLVGAS